jgi:hypothetical protein
MKGIQKAFIEEVKEGMTFKEAVLEYVDNGFEHARSRVDIVFNQKENSFKCSNDGAPIQHISEIVCDFTTHIEQSNIGSYNKPISNFGKGFKKAFLKIGDMGNGSTINIFAKDKLYNVTQYASINSVYKDENCINQTGADIWRYNDVIPYEEGTLMEIKGIENSFWISVEDFENYCADRYGLISRLKKIDLYINGKQIKFKDYCRLENLGDNINKDGVYVINDIVYWVKTYCPSHPKYGKVEFKCVYVFISRKAESEKTIDSRGGLADSGYYTFRGYRIMDCGGNAQKMFANMPAQFNTGGCERFRVAIFTDNALDFFGIRSNKSLGILPFTDNDKLKEYKINGQTMYTIFRQDSVTFGSLNTDESKNFRETGQYNELTDEMIRNRCKTYTDKKKEERVIKKSTKLEKAKKVVSEINSNTIDESISVEDFISGKPSDTISNLIDSSPLLTNREKNLLYSVVNGIKAKNNIEEIIKKAINSIEDYEISNSSNTAKAA